MNYFKIFLFSIPFLIFSCKSKPKVIVEDKPKTEQQSGGSEVPKNGTVGTINSSGNEMHEVVALEILQAERYTYMKVKEKTDEFWIATIKFEPKVGNKYFYRGGLLKTDFESQEHKRVFDKIFLVTSIIDASEHPGGSGTMETEMPSNHIHAHEPADVKGAIKLSELLANKDNFKGKTVIVTGSCVKFNGGIMGKNWVHIQDGSRNNNKVSDITITTDEFVNIGDNIAFEGKVILNKDFGAGYKYDILIENGKLK